MDARILVLAGDGIGPEVTSAAVSVLRTIGTAFGHRFTFDQALIGGAALAAGLPPLPPQTLAGARSCDAVLLGAVGDPRFDNEEPLRRPERALLQLRQALGLYANLRPAKIWPGLEDDGPLKARVAAGTDLLVVRELTGGLYYGEPRYADAESAVNTMRYTRQEIERIARVAFAAARTRRGRVTSVDKANVLEVSRLWRTVVTQVARDYPGVVLDHMYVDACAMKLAVAPASFDVILTENLFGDILSDEAGAIVGSLGLLPSASTGAGPALFEPVHGSAPDLAGRDSANPIGAISSAGMLLETLGLDREARVLDEAIAETIRSGVRTADISTNTTAATTTQVTAAIVGSIHARTDAAATPR